MDPKPSTERAAGELLAVDLRIGSDPAVAAMRERLEAAAREAIGQYVGAELRAGNVTIDEDAQTMRVTIQIGVDPGSPRGNEGRWILHLPDGSTVDAGPGAPGATWLDDQGLTPTDAEPVPMLGTYNGYGGEYWPGEDTANGYEIAFRAFPGSLPKRGPYLCRLHASCRDWPEDALDGRGAEMAHACWMEQRARTPEQRYARHERRRR